MVIVPIVDVGSRSKEDMTQRAWITIGSLFLLSGCAWDSTTYTLYRSSAVDANMRIHVATFDADEVSPYNQENCQLAADLFAKQTGVTVRYWCEQGRYRH